MQFRHLVLAAAALAPVVVAGSSGICANYSPDWICVDNCAGSGAWFYQGSGSLLGSMKLTTFALDLDPTNPDQMYATSPGVVTNISIPSWLGFLGIDFVGTGGRIGVSLNGSTSDPMAWLNITDYIPSTGSIASGNVTMDLVKASFSAAVAGGGDLGQLFKAMLLATGPVPTRMHGFADQKAAYKVLGFIPANTCLHYVHFDLVNSDLTGMQGLQDTSITALPVVVGGDPTTGLQLGIQLSINNPSNVAINTNTNVTLDLNVDGSKVGSVVLPSLALAPGANALSASSYVFPDTTDVAAMTAARKLMSNFVAGVETTVVVNNGVAAGLPVLNDAMGALSLTQTIPASAQTLLLDALVNASSGALYNPANKSDPNNKIYVYYNSTMVAYNAFDAPVQITHISATMYWTNTTGFYFPCATVNVDLAGFSIAARSNATSPPMRTLLDGSVHKDCLTKFAVAAISAAGTRINVTSSLTLDFGGYVSYLDYNQNNVLVHRKTS